MARQPASFEQAPSAMQQFSAPAAGAPTMQGKQLTFCVADAISTSAMPQLPASEVPVNPSGSAPASGSALASAWLSDPPPPMFATDLQPASPVGTQLPSSGGSAIVLEQADGKRAAPAPTARMNDRGERFTAALWAGAAPGATFERCSLGLHFRSDRRREAAAA